MEFMFATPHVATQTNRVSLITKCKYTVNGLFKLLHCFIVLHAQYYHNYHNADFINGF